MSGNTAQSSGDGVYNSRGAMTLTNVTLAANSGGNGLVGGIVNSGEIRVGALPPTATAAARSESRNCCWP